MKPGAFVIMGAQVPILEAAGVADCEFCAAGAVPFTLLASVIAVPFDAD